LPGATAARTGRTALCSVLAPCIRWSARSVIVFGIRLWRAARKVGKKPTLAYIVFGLGLVLLVANVISAATD
jgi:hypothetical protein